MRKNKNITVYKEDTMEVNDKLLKRLSEINTLDEWISFIIKSQMSPQKKGYLTKLWLKQKNFTKEELEDAKKYNSLWKARASKNTLSRRRRLEIYSSEKKAVRPWTTEDLKKLRENIDLPEAELIEMFKRSLQSINAKKRMIRMEIQGIDTSRTGQPWTAKEIEKLKRNIEKPNIELAIMFKRSTQSIQGKKKEFRAKEKVAS